jgi:hypothetical protein
MFEARLLSTREKFAVKMKSFIELTEVIDDRHNQSAYCLGSFEDIC